MNFPPNTRARDTWEFVSRLKKIGGFLYGIKKPRNCHFQNKPMQCGKFARVARFDGRCKLGIVKPSKRPDTRVFAPLLRV